MLSCRKLPEYWIPQDLKSVLLKDGEPYSNMSEQSKKYQRALQKLRNVDRLELAKCHYLQLLKLGLYLEEFQQGVDLRRFNLFGKKIQRMQDNSKDFKIHIQDLDKDHPLHKSCNLIEVFNVRNTAKKFVLRATEVLEDHVVAVAYPEFCDSYSSDNVYNIRFRTNNYPFRCSHYALSLIDKDKMACYLFPEKKENVCEMKEIEHQWFNKAISDNPEQKQAIFNIISKSSFPAPYILYGPPGTGKTATLVEAICQIWRETLDNVLICAPSNAAADVITKRLLNYIPAASLDRLYSRSRDSVTFLTFPEKFSECGVQHIRTSLIDQDVITCSNCSNGRILKINSKFVSSRRIVITTLVNCSRLLFLDLTVAYSYLFIDEAGQSTEPESLIAFNAINRFGSEKCQIIISGDPQQLGPGIRSKYAAPILGQSMLERLMKLEPYMKHNNNEYDSCYITKLLRNYRSHPAIIRVSNELYYDNELIACSNESPFANKEFPSEFPIIFHSVNGKEQKESSSTSSYNEAEINEVLDYVNLLLGEKIGAKVIEKGDIGIVTPFALQSKHLLKTLKEKSLEDVAVGTVEIFQGQEKEAIIVSAVRSRTFVHENREHIGFLSNPRRFNVALTRAKAVLVVVGNPQALQTDLNWQHFLRFCRENGACRGDKFDLPDRDDSGVHDVHATLRVEQSGDLFSDTFKILNIDDGIVRQKKNKYLFNGSYYDERECTIL